MNKVRFKELQDFIFIDNYLRSPVERVATETIRRMIFAVLILIVTAISCGVLALNDFQFTETVKNFLYVFCFYNVAHIVIYFYSLHKAGKYTYKEAYKDLFLSHTKEHERFVVLEYMSAMRKAANLIISNKDISEKFYAEIGTLEKVLTKFNDVVQRANETGKHEELNAMSEAYVKDELMEDMKDTLQLIKRMYERV